MRSIIEVIEEQQAGSVRDFLTALFKYKYRIMLVFILTVSAVTIVSFSLSPVYEAQSTLLVKIGREYIYRPEVTDKTPVVSVDQEEAINSEISIMTSRDLIRKVINTLSIGQIYPEIAEDPPSRMTPLEAAVIQFDKDLKVEVIKKSNVLLVTFRHENPDIAARAVNLLVEFFKEKHFQVYNGPESVFLGNQLAAFEKKLRESENALQLFKQRNGVYSLDEQRALLLRQRTELDAALKDGRSKIEGTQKRLLSLKTQMKQIGKTQNRYTESERDKIIVDAKAQLLDRQFKEQELLSKYPENNRLVVKVRKEIAMVTQFLKQQEADITSKVKSSNVVYQEAEKEALVAEADLNFGVARERAQLQQLSQLDQELKALDQKEKELQTLKREVSTNDKNYRAYLDRFEEARISNEMNQQKFANLSVIQVATPPAKPVKPNKVLNLLVGIVLGAVSGISYAFFCQYTSQGLSNPENAEKRIGLPVLATVDLKK